MPPPPTAAPPAGGAGRWARILLPVGIGAVALVIVVVLLAKGLSGASGGADSPKAAVEQLAAAARVEDPAAAIALIDPGETRSWARCTGRCETLFGLPA